MLSADMNLAARSQAQGVEAPMVTRVRPQEVVAAIPAFSRAYIDHDGADANRAPFWRCRA